ncbi:type I-E CRISPR-associated protein Cse1/CasA [Rudanella lutea]|uniref:type I-E CRISPR-associated protein Cse1/CasA n=1 Tax=Rudanella lutea TaxID=451374 RepID=UPI000361ED44|nr:type I-E CRISPR-associated protein Cse1/CasA [Rudanella lutea]
MTTYNLLDEPWLPVRWRGGEPPAAVGLREALLRAHDISELATDNPLETISLNRLLAALVASVFPELANEPEWFATWDAGWFDADRVDAYLKQYHAHFDLLSPVRPFFGNPQTDAKEISPLSRLQHAATSGNNALLFSHDLDSVPQTMTFAQAARALVCCQAAALGGGVAQPFNLCHGPLVGGAFFWLRGSVNGETSLFRALLLNLAPVENVWGNASKDAHTATWEAQDPPKPIKDQQVFGVRGLFTFQSRRLQLVTDSEGKQAVGVRYNQGSKMERLYDDPHLAYYYNDKIGDLPIRFSTSRALWQDSTIYMMTREHKGHAPRTFEWLSDPSTLNALDMARQEPLLADVFGLVNDQAKVELWRHERVTIYPSIINEPSRWIALQQMLDGPDTQTDDARKVAGRLREAVRAFATRVRLNKPWGVRLGDIERADRDAFVLMIDAESRYWLGVGSMFDTFLGKVATLPVEGEELLILQHRWQQTLHQTAQRALHQSLESFQQDARTLQALAEADMVLRYGTLYPKIDKPLKTETV